MASESESTRSFPATVDRLYAGLISFAKTHPEAGPEPGLGGSLLYAGELDAAGSALATAGNIAGAASLAALADAARQRQAVRDGVVDFLVTTLDEALRILKNSIRKRETVAVCVAQAAAEVEREMAELGVLPDLLPPGMPAGPDGCVFLEQGARQVTPVSASGEQTVLTWSVAEEPLRWMARLDEVARACLEASAGSERWAALRWLQLSPRYLGRTARGMRLLRCETEVARRFQEQVRQQVSEGTIAVPVETQLSGGS